MPFWQLHAREQATAVLVPLAPSIPALAWSARIVSPGLGSLCTRMAWDTLWEYATITCGFLSILIWFLSCLYLSMGASWYSLEITWSAVLRSQHMMHWGTYFGNSVTGYSTVGSLNMATRTTVSFQEPVITMKIARLAVSMDFIPMVMPLGGRAS